MSRIWQEGVISSTFISSLDPQICLDPEEINYSRKLPLQILRCPLDPKRLQLELRMYTGVAQGSNKSQARICLSNLYNPSTINSHKVGISRVHHRWTLPTTCSSSRHLFSSQAISQAIMVQLPMMHMILRSLSWMVNATFAMCYCPKSESSCWHLKFLSFIKWLSVGCVLSKKVQCAPS